LIFTGDKWAFLSVKADLILELPGLLVKTLENCILLRTRHFSNIYNSSARSGAYKLIFLVRIAYIYTLYNLTRIYSIIFKILSSMKKFITCSLTAIMTLFFMQSFAQSPTMVVIEEATQASCPPCATTNPLVHTFVGNNDGKVILLAYQVWWPGFDPMYEDNEEEVDVRVGDYYGFTGAPGFSLQGGAPGSWNDISQASVDAINNQTSAFDMTLAANVTNGILTVTGDVTASSGIEGDLRLRIALKEKTILKTDAPGGTNTETEYHDVFKKFIGSDAEGITLAATWAAGDSYTINEEFDINTLNIYNMSELEVIAFVQNDNDKVIHQAVQVSEVAVTVDYGVNTSALEISGLGSSICAGETTVAPVVQIQNSGNDVLTSATIVYSVNGGADNSYDWTGSLSTFETEMVTLPGLTFNAVSGNNDFAISITNPNGATDEDLSDNDLTASLPALEGTIQVTVTMNTDCWPQENSLSLMSSAGDVVLEVAAGDLEGQAEEEIVWPLDLVAGECYTFNFADSYGDGLHGSQWANSCSTDGNLKVEDSDGTELYWYDGTYDLPADDRTFSAFDPTGVEETILDSQVSIAPNPTNGLVNVTLNEVLVGETTLVVYSLSGQLISSQTLTNSVSTIDLSNQANGIYLMKIINAETAIAKKVTLQK